MAGNAPLTITDLNVPNAPPAALSNLHDFCRLIQVEPHTMWRWHKQSGLLAIGFVA